MSTILVPLDGSRFAERALPYAAALARGAGGRLVLLRVGLSTGRVHQPGAAEVELFVAGDPDEPGVAGYLDAAAAELRAAGLAADPYPYPVYAAPLEADDVAQAVVRSAADRGAQLVVMATHGRGGLGRWLYGSVAERVLRRTALPVLLVPPDTVDDWPPAAPRRVLVALDGSPLAEAALGPAGELAEMLDAELVLLRVVQRGDPGDRRSAESYLAGAVERLRAAGRVPEAEVSVGPTAGAIAAVARDRGASAVAMATHGRTGLARAVLGSVAMGVLRRVDAPVLLVRPADERGQPATEVPN